MPNVPYESIKNSDDLTKILNDDNEEKQRKKNKE